MKQSAGKGTCVTMKAYDRFSAVLDRCNELITLGNEDCKNNDVIRASVVLAVAAMERYFKDKFMEFFILECRKNGFQAKTCKELLTKAGVSEKTWRKAALSPKSCVCRTIRNKVQDYLFSSYVIHNEQAIEALYSCFGMGTIITFAIGKTNKKKIWASVKKLIDRRHQIAHHADLNKYGRENKVSVPEIKLRLSDLKDFIEGVENVLAVRFGVNNSKEVCSVKKIKVYKATYYKKQGYLKVSENPAVARIHDIEELFGISIPKRGFLYPGAINIDYQSCSCVWWPKIKEEANHAGWLNKPVYDAEGRIVQIVESNEKNPIDDVCEGILFKDGIARRIVFGTFEGERCDCGYCYRFIGVFCLDKEASVRCSKRVWQLENDCLDLAK